MKKILLKLIEFYRRQISPNKGGACCRFIPTCSEYAYTAVERFGAIKGTALALWRLLRCHPLCKGGFDPVPPKQPKKSERK